MNLIHEKILIIQAKAGNRKAAEQLIDKHYLIVYHFLFKLTANKQLAQDLTQDTFCKVWQSLNKFHGKSKFQSWLFRISYNLFIDHCRKEKELSIEDYLDIYYTQEWNENHCEDLEQIILNLKKLTPKIKIVIILHYLNEINLKEISFILDIPLGTVKSRLNAGLEQLRKTLQKQTLLTGDNNEK